MKAHLVRGKKAKIRTLINNKSGARKIRSRRELEDVCNGTIFFFGKNNFFLLYIQATTTKARFDS